MAGLDGLAGRRFTAEPYEIGRAKVREYVDATGDDPARYAASAPPSFAAVYGMTPALALFAEPDVAAVFGRLLHTEQTFTYRHAAQPGDIVLAEGQVGRVAERFGNTIVTFDTAVARADGTDVLEAHSSFLIRPEGEALTLPDVQADDAPPAASDAAEFSRDTPPGTRLGAWRRRATRADLVRYAGAGGDFNPIHWDPDHARAHGLPGVIVHGLLLFAWTVQAVTRARAVDTPLESVSARFRGVALADEDVVVEARVKAADGVRSVSTVEARTPRGPAITTTAAIVW